jgi:hypothetical protein
LENQASSKVDPEFHSTYSEVITILSHQSDDEEKIRMKPEPKEWPYDTKYLQIFVMLQKTMAKLYTKYV